MKSLFREVWTGFASFFRWIIAGLIILYLFSGVCSIAQSEIGVHQRFGRVLNDRVQPGLHYVLPWPVDKITKVPVRTINRMIIDDFYSSDSALEKVPASIVFTRMTGLEPYCITGDNNLVNIICVIQFNITDPFDYTFRVKNPDVMLRSMAGNMIIHCLSEIPIDEVLTRGKQAVIRDIKLGLQERLNKAQCGLTVSFIELRIIKPPDRVQQYFSDVIKADIDREKMTNEAESYYNDKILAAKANSTRIVQEAEAYKKEVVLKAEGETERFLKLLEGFKEKGDSSRKIIYIETIKNVLEKVGKKHIIGRNKADKAAVRLKLFCPE